MNKIFIACMFITGIILTLENRYYIQPYESELVWTGKKINGEHYGTIMFKSGFIDVIDNQIIAGEFIIDMSSIKVTDMSPKYNLKLENHLKNTDFFKVDEFPTASFKVTGSHKFFIIDDIGFEGELNIKNIALKKIIPASISINDSTAKASGIINIDRTLFGITYGSGSFFENLQDRAIDDIFSLKFNITAKR